MINALIRFSLSQRLLVILLTGLLVGGGIYGFQKLPIDAVPDVTNVQVMVITAAPALSPLEVERQITFPIEVAMSGLPGVTEIRSVSKIGLSVVTVVFEDDLNIYLARQLVAERINQARDQIPPGIGSPQMGPITTGLGEIYQYQLTAAPGSGHDPMALRTMQDWNVRRQLLGVPGITEVNSFGGLEKQFQIRVEPARLASYGLSLREVWEAVMRNNANVGGAYVEHGDEQYLVRGVGLAATVGDLEKIVIQTRPGGVPVSVRDVAQVVVGSTLRQGAVIADGEGEIVTGIAMMLKGENSRTVVERVKEKVNSIRKTLPPGVGLAPFYDRTELISRTIHTVARNLIEGALLVIIVLVLLLGNWRGALLVASMIPLSMLFAVICMVVFGVSGNLMSLGALDFGLIVDGAVVMVENAVRRRAERCHAGSREPVERTVLEACLEVGRPVVFAVAIIVLVYLPILSLVGVEGKMFKPMALTVVFALVGSLILSLTYVPAMLTLLLRGEVRESENRLLQRLRLGYRQILPWVNTHRQQALAVAGGLVLLSSSLFPWLGTEFIPRLDEGTLVIEARLLPSVSLAHSTKTYLTAQKVLKKFPEVVQVVTKIGRPEVTTDPMSVDAADFYVTLKPPAEWKTASNREALIGAMAQALEDSVPDVAFGFSQPIEMRMSELIAGVRSDVAIKVFGDDMETLKTQAERIGRIVAGVPGAADVKVEQVTGLPQLQVIPNREALARHGLNVEDVNLVVESLVAGRPAGQIFEGEQRFGLVVRLDEESSRSLEMLKMLPVSGPNGLRVPLADVAQVTLMEGPAQISREGTRRRIVVEVNVRGRDIGSFVKEAQARMDRQSPLPAGYYLTWGGQFENLQRASQRLLVVVPIALFLIFIMLFSTFQSIKQATLIYTGIPFAVVGGVVALAVRGMPFSISAGVGFIALFGVAVLNGVVMVSYINSLRDEGLSVAEAVRLGAETRLRPVLMTALVASLGFVPMAVATSAGAEVQRPLATVVIGGLLTSTLLTLVILPTLYGWFERERVDY